MWLVLFTPVLLLLLAIVVEAGHLLHARQQLANSLDAAATSAVFRWAQDGGGDTSNARAAGVDFASYNVIGTSQIVVLQSNYNATNTNENDLLTGATADLIFGAATVSGANIDFDATTEPSVFAGTLLIEANGDFDVASMAPTGFLQFTYSSPTAAPHVWVIETIEVNLRAGTDPDADFDGTTPYGEATTNLTSPPQSFYPSFQPAVAIPAPAPVLRLDFTTTGNLPQDFDPAALPTPDVYRIDARTSNLWDNIDPAAVNDGDSFGKLGVVVRVTFRNLVNSDTLSQDFTFVDDGVDNDQSIATAAAIGTVNTFAVRAAAQETVPSVCQSLFGYGIGPFTIKAESVAIYDSSAATPSVQRRNVVNYTPAAIATSP